MTQEYGVWPVRVPTTTRLGFGADTCGLSSDIQVSLSPISMPSISRISQMRASSRVGGDPTRRVARQAMYPSRHRHLGINVIELAAIHHPGPRRRSGWCRREVRDTPEANAARWRQHSPEIPMHMLLKDANRQGHRWSARAGPRGPGRPPADPEHR
jgi:hypothetical protein